MTSFRFFSSVLFLATILLQPPQAAAQSQTSREELCKLLPPGLVCAKESDSHWGNAPAKTIEVRNGVRITTATGDVSFNDVRKPDSESVEAEYRYLGFLTKHRYFLVSGIYFGEEQDYKLVSHVTGDVHTLRGNPILSPKGDFFLVIPRWHGSVTTNVELYRIDAKTIAEIDKWEFNSCSAETKPACYGISEALWLSPSEVAVFTAVHVRKGADHVRTLRYLGRVKREGDDRWVLHQEPSK